MNYDLIGVRLCFIRPGDQVGQMAQQIYDTADSVEVAAAAQRQERSLDA